MGELHNLMGLVAALLICGAPHAVRLIRAAEPSDATIGYWLQRAYFVLQACGSPLPPFSPLLRLCSRHAAPVARSSPLALCGD